MKKLYLILFSTILIIGAGFLAFNLKAQSVPGTNGVYGYAWSDVAGWISFNSCPKNIPNCGEDPNYGVQYYLEGENLGELNGYAWSDQIGWIKFGELINIQNGGNNANLDFDSGNLSGWARACIVFQAGCSGDYFHGNGNIDNNLETNPYLGGWDGWISLDGNNYGVSFNMETGAGSGYAWGGDILGWIDFSNVEIDLPVDNNICGDGEQGGIENCDAGENNGQPGSCCDSYCNIVNSPQCYIKSCTEQEYDIDNPCYCVIHPTETQCKNKPKTIFEN